MGKPGARQAGRARRAIYTCLVVRKPQQTNRAKPTGGGLRGGGQSRATWQRGAEGVLKASRLTETPGGLG